MKQGDNYRFGMPPDVFRATLVRTGMLLVFAVSIGLIWWSVNRLPPLEKRIEQENARLASVENEILQMELRWDPDDAKATEVRFDQAQRQLFGADDFVRWQDGLKRDHADLFRMAFTLPQVQTQASPLPNKVFTTTSATIELQSAAPDITTLSPYKRLVEMAQSIAENPKRIDILELSATGESNSVRTARMRVQVWSQQDVASSR